MRKNARLGRLLAGSGFRAAPGVMVVALLASTGGALAATTFPVGFRLIVDAATRHDSGQIIFGGVLVAVLFSAAFTLGVVGANVNGLLTDRVNLYLGESIARLISAAPGLEHFERQEHLRQVEQLRDNRRTLAGAPRQLLGIWQSVIRGGATVALLATVYPPILVVPVFAIAPALADRRAARVQRRSDDDLSADRRLLGDLFTLATTAAPARELRTFGIAAALATRHDELGEEVRRRTVRAALHSAAWEALGWGLFAFGFVGAIVVLVLRAAHGEVSPGQVVMSVSLLRRTQATVSSTTDTVGTLNTSIRTARQLLWLEDYVAEQTGAATPGRPAARGTVPARLARGIALSGVSFAYPSAPETVLDGIDLELPAGRTVALVGENGAGKTTLVKLLCGLYPPSSGRVLVDGEDLRELDLASWRERTTATFQDFVRFELPAQQSVGVGDLPRADDDGAVLAALARAGARELVDDLPDGLATRVGTRFTGGRELSGGQWQRLALARGLMRQAPLLIVLDEPTASLDAPTESALFARYAAAARRGGASNGAVTLLVTHRFSTVHAADLIVVLEHGRVVEVGSHRDLLARDGLYAQLYRIQAQTYVT